jgi:hypothetical protein
MRAFTRISGLLAAGVLVAGTARAQTCLGFTSLENAKMNIAGVAQFGDGFKSYGAALNSALGKVAHIGIDAMSTSFDNISDKQLDLTARLGFGINAGSVSFCPFGFFGYSKFPNVDAQKSYGGGAGAAYAVNPGGSVELIPFAGFVYARPTDTNGCVSECSNTNIFAGLGLRFGGGIQLSPQFSKSTHSGSKSVFGVSLSFPFGKQ